MRPMTSTATAAADYDWHPPAVDYADQFGLDPRDVAAIIAHPASTAPDPSAVTRDWPTQRYTRGDITVVVAYPPDRRPLIWGIYLALPLEPRRSPNGAGTGAGSRIPSTLRGLRQRVVQAGLVIRPGGRHDRVETPDGRLVVTLPLTPSDRRSIPNVWTQLRRKGYDV